MKNTINCLSLSPQLMKTWRLSQRPAIEKKHLAFNGAQNGYINRPDRREYLNCVGELA